MTPFTRLSILWAGKIQDGAHLAPVENQRREARARMMHHMSKQDRVIAFLVARVHAALECRGAAPETGAPAQSRLELCLPAEELVGRGAREMHCDLPLRGREHADGKVF